MQLPNKKSTILFILLSIFFTEKMQGQVSKEVNDQFIKLMQAFPSGFNTIKNGLFNTSDTTKFNSLVQIAGTKYAFLEKNKETGKWEFRATIKEDDELPASTFDKLYDEWKTRIASLNFNGVSLTPFATTKYVDGGKYELYEKGDAWRLKKEGLSIDKQYYNFTVRLEYLDLEEGGLLIQILVTDN